MSIFSYLRPKKVANGLIGHLGLSGWWFGSIPEDERNTIRRIYQPMGGCDLDSGRIDYSDLTPLSFLTGLARWFAKDGLRMIAYRILDQAERYLSPAKDPVEVHFFYQSQIEIFYRDRDTDEGLNRAIQACQNQIACSPATAQSFKRQYRGEPLPCHKGYTQLAIILEGQKDYLATIQLCSEAKKKGWGGDWDKRIERCTKKQDKV